MSFHFKLPSLRSADKAANNYEQFWQVGLGADHFTSQKVRFDSEKVGILSGGQVLLTSLTRKWQQQIFSSNPNFVYYKSRLAPRRKWEPFSAVSVWRKVIYLIRTCQNEGTLFTVAKKENSRLSQGKSQVTISRHFSPKKNETVHAITICRWKCERRSYKLLSVTSVGTWKISLKFSFHTTF